MKNCLPTRCALTEVSNEQFTFVNLMPGSPDKVVQVFNSIAARDPTITAKELREKTETSEKTTALKACKEISAHS